MSRYEPVVFQIGGAIHDAESGRRLVVAIMEAGFSPGDGEVFASPLEVLEHLEASNACDLEIHCLDMPLETLADFESTCQTLGLPYLRRLSDQGTDDEVQWVPGADHPISASMVGTGTPGEVDYGVPLDLIRRAYEAGGNAISDLLASYDAVEKSILVVDMDLEAISTLKALDGPAWNVPIAAVPTGSSFAARP